MLINLLKSYTDTKEEAQTKKKELMMRYKQKQKPSFYHSPCGALPYEVLTGSDKNQIIGLSDFAGDIC